MASCVAGPATDSTIFLLPEEHPPSPKATLYRALHIQVLSQQFQEGDVLLVEASEKLPKAQLLQTFPYLTAVSRILGDVRGWVCSSIDQACNEICEEISEINKQITGAKSLSELAELQQTVHRLAERHALTLQREKEAGLNAKITEITRSGRRVFVIHGIAHSSSILNSFPTQQTKVLVPKLG